jgi:hypothetical protein
MNQQLARLSAFGYRLAGKNASDSELRRSTNAVPKVEDIYCTTRLVACVKNQKGWQRHFPNPTLLIVKRKPLRQGRQTQGVPD